MPREAPVTIAVKPSRRKSPCTSDLLFLAIRSHCHQNAVSPGTALAQFLEGQELATLPFHFVYQFRRPRALLVP
jgi:hypothetical protein